MPLLDPMGSVSLLALPPSLSVLVLILRLIYLFT
jgi:hypothetical protein